MPDWKAWAQRTVSRGGAQPSTAPEPVPHQQILPPPPPGYGYAPHPQYGFVLVPLAQAASPPAFAQPLRQPQGLNPYITQPPAIGNPPANVPRQMGRVIPLDVKTCALVKPGNRDTYAEFLATVPDLAPDYAGGYDAMAGRPSPETMRELGMLSEAGSMNGELAAYATPMTAKASGPELGAVALPDINEKVG